MKQKTMAQRVFALLLAVGMAAGLGGFPVGAVEYTDGTYTGTAPGYGGDVTVSVTISGGVITDVEPVSYSGESPTYWEEAVEVLDRILEAQSPDVDAVTGATASSNGLKYAVAEALAAANPEEETGPNASIFASGRGTASRPFLIDTAEQLRAFGASVSMRNNYTGYVVRLQRDIDISDADWEPIGGADAFNGTFDGAGHTIRGLTMGTTETPRRISDDISNVGFFGNLGGSAVVKDLTLDGVMLNVYHPGLLRVGALAGATGRREGVAGPVIQGVNINGSLTVHNDNGNIWAGGYVGMLFTGSILNCTADIDVYALSSASDPSYRVTNWVEAGGITGLNFWGEIANSVTLGDVTAGCIRQEPDEETAADNADALENGPIGTEEISVAICAVGGISGLDLGHTENVYTAGNVTAIGACECISATVGYSEESHSEEEYEYTHLDHIWVNADVAVDNNGTAVGPTALPRYEEGAEIGAITLSEGGISLLNALNDGVEAMAVDKETTARMNTFGAEPSLLQYWVLDGETPVPAGISVSSAPGDKTTLPVDDGIYTGTAGGFGGPTTATVTVRQGVIIGMALENSGDTEAFFNTALGRLRDVILAGNSPEVDAVSGATISSNGILNAVKNALGMGRTEAKTFHVSNYAELRDAAGAAIDGDTIEFTADITDAGIWERANADGSVDAVSAATVQLTKAVIINGNNHSIQASDMALTKRIDENTGATVEIDPAHTEPVFAFFANVPGVVINDLTITGASYWDKCGGGMYLKDNGGVTLNRVTFENCHADKVQAGINRNGGGAIYAEERNIGDEIRPYVIANNCTFLGNVTSEDGTSGRGGAIAGLDADIELNDCVFSGNRAGYGGAVCLFGENSSLKVTNCTFDASNDAVWGGDDIYVFDGYTWQKAKEQRDSSIPCEFSGNTYGPDGDSWTDYRVVRARVIGRVETDENNNVTTGLPNTFYGERSLFLDGHDLIFALTDTNRQNTPEMDATELTAAIRRANTLAESDDAAEPWTELRHAVERATALVLEPTSPEALAAAQAEVEAMLADLAAAPAEADGVGVEAETGTKAEAGTGIEVGAETEAGTGVEAEPEGVLPTAAQGESEAGNGTFVVAGVIFAAVVIVVIAVFGIRKRKGKKS